MANIYMHYGSKEFDPEKLKKSVEDNWDRWKNSSMMECALWASPFNVKMAQPWESFWYSDSASVEKHSLTEASKDKGMHSVFIDEKFMDFSDFSQFYNQPKEQMVKTLVDFAQIEHPESNITKEDLKSLVSEAPSILARAKDILRHKCAEFRENTFFFVLTDDKKILHVNTQFDINQYIKDITPAAVSFRMYTLDYDKIKNDGYCGIELHNAATMRSNSLFYSWEADSISIWDPSCVKIIDKEIAAIARLASGATTSTLDVNDPVLNIDYLIDWVDKHMEETQKAIDEGIISLSQIAEVFSSRLGSSGRSNKEQSEQEKEPEQAIEQEETPQLIRD